MWTLGICTMASSLHADLLDLFTGEKMEGARVVAAEHADGIARWDADCLGLLQN